MSWLSRLLGWAPTSQDVLMVTPGPVAPPPQPAPGQYAPPAVPALTVGEGLDDAWTGGVPRAAITLSEAFEARVLHPYQDGNGTWTIGIGSTRDLAGRPVTKATPPLTDAQAEALALRDLKVASTLVKSAIKVPLTNRRAAVLILLANNVGALTLKAPTIVARVNAGRWRDAADFLKEFRNETVGGKLRPVLGLRRRRWAEAAFSLGLDAAAARKRAWVEIGTVDGWPALP